jgi:carbamoyl-phosphate synthase large subunit
MVDLITEKRIDVFVPLIDEELLQAWDIQARVSYPLRIATPAPAFTRLTLDKLEMARAFRQRGLPVPETRLLADVLMGMAWDLFPAVVKPRQGRGSRGVVIVQDREALHRRMAGIGEDEARRYLIQAHVSGVEYTVSVVASGSGEVLAIVPKEVIEKRGITRVAVTRRNPTIADLCRRIQREFAANGPFNVQLILDHEGRPVVFEVNPRFSTTVSLTMAAGVNEVDMVIRDRLGERVDPADFLPDLYLVRHEESLFRTAAELGLA